MLACVRINNFGNALKREGKELNYGTDSLSLPASATKTKTKDYKVSQKFVPLLYKTVM